MYQISLYNGALNVGTDYSDIVNLTTYRLPAWEFGLYHIHAGTVGSTLTLTIQYSLHGDVNGTWTDGAKILDGGAIGSGVVAVDETIYKLYPMKYLRFKIVVAVQNASSIFLSLGMA